MNSNSYRILITYMATLLDIVEEKNLENIQFG
jgi:hypothetical protein